MRQIARQSVRATKGWNVRQDLRPVDDPQRIAQMYIQMYANDRLFSWDDRKSEANLRERGFDFGFATSIFTGPTLERRVISARRASKKERSAYDAKVKAEKR